MLFNDKSRQTVIDLTAFDAHPTRCPHVRPLPLLPQQLQPLAALLLSSKRERFTQMDTIISPSLHSRTIYLSLYCTQQLVSSTSRYWKTNS